VGFVYFVFLPSIVTTLLAGNVVDIFGIRRSLWGGLVVAALGLPLMLSSHLVDVLAGMVLVGVGTFFAQACATGFIGQAARTNRGVASGTYLACYFLGGLIGGAALGQVFDRLGWIVCVAGVGAALGLACALTVRLKLPQDR
jgi:MFS family permease